MDDVDTTTAENRPARGRGRWLQGLLAVCVALTVLVAGAPSTQAETEYVRDGADPDLPLDVRWVRTNNDTDKLNVQVGFRELDARVQRGRVTVWLDTDAQRRGPDHAAVVQLRRGQHDPTLYRAGVAGTTWSLLRALPRCAPRVELDTRRKVVRLFFDRCLDDRQGVRINVVGFWSDGRRNYTDSVPAQSRFRAWVPRG